MPNVIAYVCDQTIPYCCHYCLTKVSECRHTFDRTHAKNETVDPEKAETYPERFTKVGMLDGLTLYEEVEK